MEKEAIRQRYRAKRAELSNEQRAEMTDQLCRLFAMDEAVTSCLLAPNGLMHTYLPIDRQREVSTWPLLRHVWQHYPATRTGTPVPVPGTFGLSPVLFTAETVLTPTSRGIPVPAPPTVPLTTPPNLVLVPLLAFDGAGHRVGYGGGYYDRYLAGLPPDCLKVGLSFFGPTLALIPAEPTDVALDGCITPDRIYWFLEKNPA